MNPVIYDASGSERLSASAWRVMFRELRDFRELAFRLTQRNIIAQFRQSFLGLLWIILPPVATTLTFAMLRAAEVVRVPMDGHVLPYTLFTLIGTTLWGFFTQITVACTSSIANAGNLVSKVYFPREVLILSSLGTAIVNLVIRMVLIAMTFALYQQAPAWQSIFAPLLLIPLVAFALGLALLFAPVNAMMQDMGRFLEFLFQFGMFLAPTVYPTPSWSSHPGTWEVALIWIHALNPVACMMSAFVEVLEFGTFSLSPSLFISVVISFLTLAIGWRIFHICEPMLAERL